MSLKFNDWLQKYDITNPIKLATITGYPYAYCWRVMKRPPKRIDKEFVEKLHVLSLGELDANSFFWF